mmetsp:Transcript_16004/g.34579  ORF Transcript_16004/g.34579 Transcript_16004/m.34579 type:complete len:341 (+) Transcript_16004:1904-2926(+)
MRSVLFEFKGRVRSSYAPNRGYRLPGLDLGSLNLSMPFLNPGPASIRPRSRVRSLSSRFFLPMPLRFKCPDSIASSVARCSRTALFLLTPMPILEAMRGALSAFAPRLASIRACHFFLSFLSRALAPSRSTSSCSFLNSSGVSCMLSSSGSSLLPASDACSAGAACTLLAFDDMNAFRSSRALSFGMLPLAPGPLLSCCSCFFCLCSKMMVSISSLARLLPGPGPATGWSGSDAGVLDEGVGHCGGRANCCFVCCCCCWTCLAAGCCAACFPFTCLGLAPLPAAEFFTLNFCAFCLWSPASSNICMNSSPYALSLDAASCCAASSVISLQRNTGGESARF